MTVEFGHDSELTHLFSIEMFIFFHARRIPLARLVTIPDGDTCHEQKMCGNRLCTVYSIAHQCSEALWPNVPVTTVYRVT